LPDGSREHEPVPDVAIQPEGSTIAHSGSQKQTYSPGVVPSHAARMQIESHCKSSAREEENAHLVASGPLPEWSGGTQPYSVMQI